MKILLAFCLVLAACAIQSRNDKGPAKKSVAKVKKSKMQKSFEEINELYQNGYYPESIQKIKAFQKKYAVSKYEAELLFLQGKALFADGDIAGAEKSFRASQSMWSKSLLGQAKSLYFLSQVYERQNLDAKAIASLLQLLKMPKVLDERFYQLDVPAKLAAAYAREGNIAEASRYHSRVDAYLKKFIPLEENLEKESYGLVNLSLHSIGENSLVNNKARNFQEQVEAIRYSQEFLLRSIEMGGEPWAAKSLYRFQLAYRDLLNSVVASWAELYRWKDQVAAIKIQKQKLAQLDQIHKLILALEELLLPRDAVNNDVYKDFLVAKDAIKKEVEIYFHEPEVGQGLTDAAKKLEGMPVPMKLSSPKETKKKYQKQMQIPLVDPNL